MQNFLIDFIYWLAIDAESTGTETETPTSMTAWMCGGKKERSKQRMQWENEQTFQTTINSMTRSECRGSFLRL